MTDASVAPSPRALRSRRAVAATLTALALVLTAACSDSDDRGQPGSRGAQGASDAGGGRGSGDGSVAASLQSDFVRVVQKIRPSVVEISHSAGLGSGIVYDDKGNIVTNAHVVADATQFKVTFVDGRTLDATLVGSYRPDDIAVVRVRGDGQMVPATFAESSKVEVGQIALAIGNPLGLASSVTEGIVSSTGRTVSEGGIVLPSTIQTSAPINPGNSGGALVGLDASVIGIPTLAATVPELGGAAPGIGFAIPSNRAKFIADQLVGSGTVTHSGRAALGISAATVASRSGEPLGVLVWDVQPGGAAEAAGIAPGHIVTAINERPTPTLDALGTVLADPKPGDGATVTVLRPDGSKRPVRVTPGNL